MVVQLEAEMTGSLILDSICTYISVLIDSCIEVSCRLSVCVQMVGMPGFHWFALSANNKSISLGVQNVGNMLHSVRRKAAFSVGYDCTKSRKQNVDFSERISSLLSDLFSTSRVNHQHVEQNTISEALPAMQKDLKVMTYTISY